MSLESYRRKRDFKRTPEPSGDSDGRGAPPPHGNRFVVQRHRASRLHYDFRLEIDGVLASWAVPKGPSLNPGDRRMAVHVEDHPLGYFDFEGIIPKGEYGGGDVIVWDWGTFEPEETDDPGKAVRKGELKFRLHGEKLRGRFTLVKTRGQGSDEDNWLLIHKKDDDADPDWNVDEHPRSVKTGRTNDEVLAGADAVWDSAAPADVAAIDLTGAREAPLPEFIEPMKATAADSAFDDPDWLFELKLDGYRVEAVVDRGKVRLWTRNKQDAARYFPDLAGARPTWIRAQTAVVDGEVVALNAEGRPEFSLLQDRAGMGRFGPGRSDRGSGGTPPRGRDAPIAFYVFDILYHDGRLLLDVPLEQRKRLLRSVLNEHPVVHLSTHADADGTTFLEAVEKQGLEGMVAKLRTSRYEPGRRSRAWLKVKIRREQEVVIVGYEPGKGSHAELGSLILAVYEGGELHFAGEVGSGLDERTRRELRRELEAHALDEPPVVNPPRIKGARWSQPRLVARIEFSEWTDEGYVRQAAFKALDIGRDPRTVRREVHVPARRAADQAEREAAKAAAKRGGADRNVSVTPRHPSDPFIQDPGSRSDPPQAATAEELAALDAMGEAGTWEIGGHTVPLTNLDKVLFPGPDYTKRDLIRYYAMIAPVMLPYLRGRALNLWRWPDGVAGGHFWQKEIPKYAPDWIARWSYPEAESSQAHTYLVADRVATMAWLANHATIDMHPWTSRTQSYRTPDFALIDIDPGEKTTFSEIVTLARLYRAALDHLGVTGCPKVTGKRGIQIWVPVAPKYTFDDTRQWVEALSRAVGGTVPDLVSWEWEKAARRGRARLDFTQNAINKTLVAPYAVRPVQRASVSAPITWDELDDPELRPDAWDIRSILERVKDRGDLFTGVLEVEQELPAIA